MSEEWVSSEIRLWRLEIIYLRRLRAYFRRLYLSEILYFTVVKGAGDATQETNKVRRGGQERGIGISFTVSLLL